MVVAIHVPVLHHVMNSDTDGIQPHVASMITARARIRARARCTQLIIRSTQCSNGAEINSIVLRQLSRHALVVNEITGHVSNFPLVKIVARGITRPLFPPHSRIGVWLARLGNAYDNATHGHACRLTPYLEKNSFKHACM